jgi:cell division protein FtsB
MDFQLPKLQALIEARSPKLKYTEKRVKNVLSRVTLELAGNDSGVVTHLAKRYERLDKSAKLLKEKRDELNAKVKDLADDMFNPEDFVITRVIDTVTYTLSLSAAEKAEAKSPTAKVDFEAAFLELSKLVPELTEQVDAIRQKYTEMIPPKDTPTRLTVKSKVDEGLISSIKRAWDSFVNVIKNWCAHYDDKLSALKKKYPVPKVNVL